MYDRDLQRFREAIRVGDYRITQHALDEMDADELSILDVEAAILSGKIVERQRDRLTGERKYVIGGQTLDRESVGVVAKWTASGRMGIITVYRM